MLTSIKKLIAGDGAKPRDGPAPEYIFLFDLERKKEWLLDLRAILRTPGSRRALPRLHKLETIVTRNDQRIRIPHEAMPELVRELVSVERRVPEQSPLRELMDAVPGLAASIRVDPTPTSVLMGKHEEVPGELNTREMNTAARRIGEALARQEPPATSTAPQAKPAALADKPAVKPGAEPPPKSADKPQSKQAAVAPGKPASAPAAKPAPGAPAKAEPKKPAETSFGDTTMSSSEQQRFLQESSAQFEAEVLRTGDLADSDLAGYLDLCLMSGENEKVIDTLLPRVGEKPSAWAWIRLLKAAEVMKKLEFEVWCSNFHSWIKRDHPALLPDKKTAKPEELLFGVHSAGLQDLERQELKP